MQAGVDHKIINLLIACCIMRIWLKTQSDLTRENHRDSSNIAWKIDSKT